MDANVRHLMTQLRQNPLDFGVLDALRQHCEATHSYAIWAEALEHHARAATAADGDPIELGRLHYELGNLYRTQLGRSDRALVHYRTAIDFDASQRPALAAARTLTTEAGDWAEAADLLAREADSLPAGRKRAAALVELAQLYKTRLRDREQAEGALREAVGDAPDDLQVQHELATSLLESADQLGNVPAADEKRSEAAAVLSTMARAVSDDYALAYVEAALDAVPDHHESLRLLESVAPRMGRSDTLAPRWLAAIRGTSDRALARALRLKMAHAYVTVGQLDDARICLEPLLGEQDAEALALARSALGAKDRPGKPVANEPARAQQPEVSPPQNEEELLSSEMLLESQEAPLTETELASPARAPLDRGHDASVEPRSESLAHELANLSEHLDENIALASARAPLADLATLDRRAEQGSSPKRDLRNLLESSELSDERLTADEFSDDDIRDDNSREELLDSTELSTVSPDSGAQERPVLRAEVEPGPEERRPTSRPPRLPVSSGLIAQPTAEPVPAAAARDDAPRGSDARDAGARLSQLPHDDDEPDPFSEQTQPRATPLTLAELTALTGNSDRNTIIAPAGELSERELGGEVTQITPAEDPQVTELRSLRAELARRLRFRDRRGAAEVSETLLERGVFDAEAIEALEDHYRLARDFEKLRDLSLRLARELSFTGELRGTRLREAVMLSESKLGDQEGAIAALRELLALEPSDAEAVEKLLKLLKRAQRWPEWIELLERRVAQLAHPKQQAELLRELGAVSREKLAAVGPAIAAYARARALDPGNHEDELALTELYLGNQQFADAAALYEARLASVPEGETQQRVPLLSALTHLYEERLHDDEGTQRTLEAWRRAEPRKPEPLHALLRILERRGDHRALVDALVDQLELASPSDRVRIHLRIAELALTTLGDAARAADSYGEAILLAPQNASFWRAAAPAFEQAGRAEELDELLFGIAQGNRDRALSSALFAHLAETRAARADVSGAILAREAQYAVNQELPALEALVSLLRETERASVLSRRLDELARRSPPEVARNLRLERATVQSDKLGDPEAAKAEVEQVLAEFGADDAAALRRLVELCVATGDTKRRASAQERLVKLAPSLSARVDLATELVDIYEHELSDIAGASRVLSLWTTLEPENPTPYMRLLPLLAQSGQKRELVEALDKLATLANSDEETGEFLLRAARAAIELEDFEGAWNRLVPRVVDAGDAEAERLLRELTRTAGRGEQLAALYVGLAQRTSDADVERRRWADAARVFEQEVAAYDRALEAMLRALAKQLDNRDLLGEVERLSERANAWTRLGQVYDTIVRKADTAEARIQLLMRHSHLLETRAADPSAAFERIWLAYQLDPSVDGTYAEARRLAQLTGRREELLGTYERRAQSAASKDSRVEALLEACAIAQHELEDTARATGYLSRAVGLAGDATALLDTIEARVRDLDGERPPIGGRGLMAELTGVYAQLAHENAKSSPYAAVWLSRAARIHELELDDPDAAFRALEHASTLAPSDETLLDELNRVAALGENWEALARHLQQAADSAIDSNSSSASLSRLGALCERELSSPSRAADAYEQLVRLRPKDSDASRRLRQCLRAAERFDELLIAIDRELFMLKPEEGKRELLKQAAETWEFGLKNRYEALDAWKKVSAIAPADPDAVAALARLRPRARADDSLLDEEVVVLPEDLRPSLVGTSSVSSSLFGGAGAQTLDSAVSTTFLADHRPLEARPSARQVSDEREPRAGGLVHDDVGAVRGHDSGPFAQAARALQAPAPEELDEDERAAQERVSGEVRVSPIIGDDDDLDSQAADFGAASKDEGDRDEDEDHEKHDQPADFYEEDSVARDSYEEDSPRADLSPLSTAAAAPVGVTVTDLQTDLDRASADPLDDLAELRFVPRDFDADVTLPLDRRDELDRDERRRVFADEPADDELDREELEIEEELPDDDEEEIFNEPSVVSLDGLSSLLDRSLSAPPRSVPPPPPPAVTRPTPRVPPPPPRPSSAPKDDD